MIDHISIGVRDLTASSDFYETLLGTIGMQKITEHGDTAGFGKKYPEFWLNHRLERQPQPDNGNHVCIRVESVDAVEAFYAKALELGAGDDGGPGLRPEYHESYYAAFVVDSDGNKIEVVTFVEIEQ